MRYAWFLLWSVYYSAVWAADYRYNRDLSQAQTQLSAVILDAAVYRDANNTLSDLRIVDAQEHDVPYWLQTVRQTRTEVVRQPVATQTPDLQRVGEYGIDIHVRLQPNAPDADGLTLLTEQRDFEYDIRVSGSENGSDWQVLVQHAAIYDYSRYMDAANREIKLPPNHCRVFKIAVDYAEQNHSGHIQELTRVLHANQEQQRSETVQIEHDTLHIDALEFWHEQSKTVAAAEQQSDYALGSLQIHEDAAQQITQIDLDAEYQPIDSLQLAISTPAYDRVYRVESAEFSGGRFRVIASGRLQGMHIGTLQHAPQPLQFAVQRAAQYRIVIENQDNPPLGIQSVVAKGPVMRLLFISQPGAFYRLRYGSKDRSAPRYDTAGIQALLEHNQPAETLTLAPASTERHEQALDYREIGAQWLDSPLFLGLCIVLLIAVLAWSIWSLWRKSAEDVD
jgi:hypothetical protein